MNNNTFYTPIKFLIVALIAVSIYFWAIDVFTYYALKSICPFGVAKEGEFLITHKHIRYTLHYHWETSIFKMFALMFLISIGGAIIEIYKKLKDKDFTLPEWVESFTMLPSMLIMMYLWFYKALYKNTGKAYDFIFNETNNEDAAFAFGAITVVIAFISLVGKVIIPMGIMGYTIDKIGKLKIA